MNRVVVSDCVKCDVCNKIMDFNKIIKHHISYFPEVVIKVCQTCHGYLHKSPGFARRRKDYLNFYGYDGAIFCRRRPKQCKGECKSCIKVKSSLTNTLTSQTTKQSILY